MKVLGQKINLYNMPTPEMLKDIGDDNNLNLDNKVFLSKREFIYSYKFINSNKNKICVVFLDQKCIDENRKDCINWSLHNSIKGIPDWQYPIKNIRLYVFSKKSNTSLSNSQTLIKYEYYNEIGQVFFGERTGVVEDSTRVFLHQPRQYVFAITELNPFPEIRFPLTIGKEWKSITTIPPLMLETIKYDALNKTDFISRNLTYKVVDKTKIKSKLGKITCFKIEANAEGTLKKTSMIAYFNDKFGFVKIIFNNLDGSVIILNLDSVKNTI